MSGDLSILKFKTNPPTHRDEIGDDDTLPLGTLREIKAILEQLIPAIEWETEPSLLSILQQCGSEIWKDWGADQLASSSQPRLVGLVHTDDLVLRFHSLPTDEEAEVPYLLVELHSVGNPYVPLQFLCEQNGWVAVGPNPEDEFIDFDQTIAQWEDWTRNENQYLEEAHRNRILQSRMPNFFDGNPLQQRGLPQVRKTSQPVAVCCSRRS